MSLLSVLEEYKKTSRIRAARLKERTIEEIHTALTRLSEEIHFEDAYIFGSILNTSFSEGSDVDIAFVGLKDEDFFRAMAFLSRVLERDVDVIQLEGHRLKDKIIKEGIRWQR